ncbi:MAG: hypothetical protein QW829_03490 [Candidatus Bathyarchaeia archaeon]
MDTAKGNGEDRYKAGVKEGFKTIEGKFIGRSTSFVRIKYGGHETVVEVVMAEDLIEFLG